MLIRSGIKISQRSLATILAWDLMYVQVRVTLHEYVADLDIML